MGYHYSTYSMIFNLFEVYKDILKNSWEEIDSTKVKSKQSDVFKVRTIQGNFGNSYKLEFMQNSCHE